MKNNKLTYLLDGNFFMYKTLHIVGAFDEKYPMFLKEDSEEKREKDKNVFIGKLAMDLCSDIRKASKLIDEIIITMDDYSWRNDFFNDKQYHYREPILDEAGNILDDEGNIIATAQELQSEDLEIQNRVNEILSNIKIDYKGHRVKDKGFNWSFVYSVFEKFLIELRDLTGSKFVKIRGCEGDDIIFGVCEYYLKKGKSVMIYSGDNDLKQLISHNPQFNNFVIHHKKTEKKLVMSTKTAKYFMGEESQIKTLIKDFSFDNELELVAENPFEIIFEKVLTGDSGDNVMPVIREPRQFKSGKRKGEWRNVNITDSIVNKIKEEVDYKKYSFNDLFSDDFIDMLANSVIRNFKPLSKFRSKNIANNIRINRDLVFLHKDCLPNSIYETIIEWVEQNQSESNLSLKEYLSYKALLEKMPNYTQDESNKATTASFFKYLDL